VPAGSIIDFTVHTEKPASVETVNEALSKASKTDRMKGILGVTEEKLVSADIIGSGFSSLVDLNSTMAVGDHDIKVLAWYDNEWGYSMRCSDLAAYIAKK
jgi:glyceraldehyde 3-phosphate dehydrogenase